jgi:hypothetical protein
MSDFGPTVWFSSSVIDLCPAYTLPRLSLIQRCVQETADGLSIALAQLLPRHLLE